MTEPPEWALRAARRVLVAVGKAHGREVHGRYYEDNKSSLRTTALALVAARRQGRAAGIEDAAASHERNGGNPAFRKLEADAIRALIAKAP